MNHIFFKNLKKSKKSVLFIKAVLPVIALSAFLYSIESREGENYFDNERSSPVDKEHKKTKKSQKKKKKRIKTQINKSPVSNKKEGSDPENEVSDDEKDNPLAISGFLKQTLTGAQSTLPEGQRFKKELISSYTRLRLDAQYNDEQSDWSWQATGNLDGIFSNFSDSPEFDYYWKLPIRNRLMSLETTRDEDEYLLRADAHRLWLGWSNDKLDLKAGRQTISWGQGRFLNPLDLITPTGPFILDLEDIPGADVLYALYSFNSFDILELVVVPGRKRDDTDLNNLYYKDSNALVRYKATSDDLDFSILGGHHFQSWVWGGELSYTIWGAGFRAGYLGRSEYALEDYPYYEDENLPAQVSHQFTIGASYAFFGKLRSNLELLFNSAYTNEDRPLQQLQEREMEVALDYAQPDDRDSSFFRTTGRIITKNPFLIQLSLDFDIKDVWTLSLLGIADTINESYFLSPGISWNFSDEGVWVLGAQLFEEFRDEGKGEFEGLSPMVYTYIRFHF